MAVSLKMNLVKVAVYKPRQNFGFTLVTCSSWVSTGVLPNSTSITAVFRARNWSLVYGANGETPTAKKRLLINRYFPFRVIFPGGHRLTNTNYTRVGKQIFDLALKVSFSFFCLSVFPRDVRPFPLMWSGTPLAAIYMLAVMFAPLKLSPTNVECLRSLTDKWNYYSMQIFLNFHWPRTHHVT